MKWVKNMLYDGFRRLLYGACLLSVVIANDSCTTDYLESEPVSNNKGLKISLGGPVVQSAEGESIVSDMRLYCFAQSGGDLPGGRGNPSSVYHHIVTGLTRSGMTLTTQQMRTGLWDMVLVSPQGGTLTSPEMARSAGDQLMYSYAPAVNEATGKSSDAHQVYYRYMRLPEIISDAHMTVSTSAARNMAKVRVVVERAVDVDQSSNDHTITLNKVPTKLSWAGTVLKTNAPGSYVTDVVTPDVTSLTGKVSFTPTAESGVFKSDTLDFIIPAHRGGDFWNSDKISQNQTPADTLKCKMTLSASFAKPAGRGVYEKQNVEIPVVARCNDILVVRVKMRDVNLEINTSVQPWDEEDVDGSVKTPFLNVSETETTVYDGAVSRIYFWSNQPSDSVYVTSEGKDGGSLPIADINTIFDRLAGTLAANRNYVYTNKNGEGYLDIAHVNTAVEGTSVRKIYLNAGGLKSEITVNSVITAQAAKNISIPYVGTFHRHNEIGERIVTWANSGDWTATVLGASADQVLIDRLPSPAFRSLDNVGLYTGTDSENRSVVEASQVSDWGSTVVSGRGRVYFRIGWRSTVASSQVRYARVKIEGTDVGGPGVNTTYVYLRQGEAEDYLMRPQDRDGRGATVEAGESNTYRKYAIRFSPYNLSSLSAPTASGVPLAAGGGTFSSYPSQAGAFFQWATSNVNYAYDPSVLNVTGWSNAYYPDAFWESLSETHEACPPGYRRPNDGSTTAVSGGSVAGSEIRQSLFLDPMPSQDTNAGNSIWGYMADGYFDRKTITGSVNGTANSAVTASTSKVAYIGRLYYNPTTDASLFFPAAGTRTESGGQLQSSGSGSGFWSASLYSAGASPQVWTMNPGAIYAVGNRVSPAAGMLIRCVEHTFTLSPTYVWLSSTAGNTTRTITISSKAGWTAVNIPASITMSQTSGIAGKLTVTLTRKDAGYGLQTLQIRDLATNIIYDVDIDNLALISPVDQLQVPGTGTTGTLEVNAYGKSAQWLVRSKPDWVMISNNDGEMSYSVEPEVDEQDRDGVIVLYHADDVDLTVSIQVHQSANYIMFPEFNYMVVKVKHSLGDDKTLDTRIELMNTGISGIDGIPVGYVLGGGIGYSASYKALTFLSWAGDSHGQGFSYMTSMVNMWNLTKTSINDEFAPDKRFFNVDVYATWYNGATTPPANPSQVDVGVDILLYKGGTMASQNFDYVNTGGTLMLNETYSGFRVLSISTTGADYANYRTHYTKLGTITYDRFKNTATFERMGDMYGAGRSAAVRPASIGTKAAPADRVRR